MIDTKDPSGQFGIWRELDGGFRLEFYRPDGFMVSRTTFDAEAAREFLAAVTDAVGSGCRACGAPDHPSGCAADVPNVLAGSATRTAIARALRDVAGDFEMTPLSEREADRTSDYTDGWHAAARVIRARADLFDGGAL